MRNTITESIYLLKDTLKYITIVLSFIVIGVFIYSLLQPRVYIVDITMIDDLANEQQQRDDFMRHCTSEQYCECSYNFTKTFYSVLTIQQQNMTYQKTGKLPDYLIESHQFCRKYK